ncbi:ABC transporter substrate-binding protein [Roseomonas gilardii]|uniref:ABC transporter substrate-binding protein n=1 Tax=Roseomonas gilardii TaxID=257708 RepID=UPI000489646E|nr:extracellular solute-binding protein [Roseomonas gilardii]SUE63469.1 Uncharacterised protein [Roseomonas gilardii subsp. rosea]
MDDVSKGKRGTGIGRRTVLRGALGGAAALGAPLAAPAVHAQGAVTLRYLGLGVNQSPAIAQRCKEETGITIEYTSGVHEDIIRRVVTQPNTFDLVDTDFAAVRQFMPSGNIVGIEVKRVKLAEKIAPLFTRGEVAGHMIGDQGSAPKKTAFLTGARSKAFAQGPTEWMSLIPINTNADTLGIRPDLIGRPIGSWAELLNPEFKGKAALVNSPSVGIMDAAMVAESIGKVKYADKGNMTRAEIDATLGLMTEAKKAGQFRAFWSDFNESVNLMGSGETVIQSMWSPAVTKVRSQGIPCVFQPLKEGYRGWGLGLGIPRTLEGRKLDAAYEFINWFLSGWVGATLLRQGYYPSVPETARQQMEPYEWAYWMEGKPAERDIKSPAGVVVEKAGTVRDGGSYEQRMGNVACWNSVMDENAYLIRKWNEFIVA